MMKFLCNLLIVLTVMLSSSPCCAGDVCCNETGAECAENNPENHHSDGPVNSCSPFMVCGSCSGFVVLAFHTDLNPEPVLTGERKVTSAQKYFDNYYPKFWQPPKIS